MKYAQNVKFIKDMLIYVIIAELTLYIIDNEPKYNCEPNHHENQNSHPLSNVISCYSKKIST